MQCEDDPDDLDKDEQNAEDLATSGHLEEHTEDI